MKFYLHKLGCPKNDVDAEYIIACLVNAGHEYVTKPEDADSIIVNTCGFIQSAKEESIDEILRLGQLKKDGNLKKLIASGCLSQRYGDELLKGIPELDSAVGIGRLESIVAAVDGNNVVRKTSKFESRKLAYLDWKHRFISDGYPYAYLKVSDGCNRDCSFCAIPSIRGKYRSRPMESIINEARFLAENGKRELILVSQEVTLWGLDLKKNQRVINLLQELEKIEAVRWIRPMYLYPTVVTNKLIDYMSSGTKTLNYFDIPLQHINDDMLKAMNRRTTKKDIETLFDKIRNSPNKPVMRTTFIVGYPGETDKKFLELKEFVKEQRFDRMGVFTYSAEEGTPGGEIKSQIPEKEKMARLEELMLTQQEISFEKNISLLGSLQEVIIDEVSSDGIGKGRTRGDCPEIDQEVFVNDEELEVGEIYLVKIDKAEGYDLFGSRSKG